MINETDLHKALSRESCDIEGVPYRPFAWSPEIDEDLEPPFVPAWVFLPGLPPNFYHSSVLEMLTAPIGRYIRRDNPTTCATRTDRARVCLEIDASKEQISHFWIGIPGMPRSRRQEIIYETLPAYCLKCRCQGHNQKTCRYGRDPKPKEKGGKIWVKKSEQLKAKGENIDSACLNAVFVTNSTAEKTLVPVDGVVISDQGELSKEDPRFVEQMQEVSEEHLMMVVPDLVDENMAANTHEVIQKAVNDVEFPLDNFADEDDAGQGTVGMPKSGLCEDAFGMGSRFEVLYEGKQPSTVALVEYGPSFPLERIIVEELNEEVDEELAHDGCIHAQYGCDPVCADDEREKNCIDGFVCSDSDSDGVFEHLSKENLVVSDSDIQSEMTLSVEVVGLGWHWRWRSLMVGWALVGSLICLSVEILYLGVMVILEAPAIGRVLIVVFLILRLLILFLMLLWNTWLVPLRIMRR
ncbi:uncharacterized protein LOC109018801 [Juglans regia]|nr:uncharacterized protein LOC109018801 [Juglans regia]